mgnify:CR=1 FL=1
MEQMKPGQDNLIVNLCIEFSLYVMDFCEILKESKKFTIASQLLRAGTSIGANTFEAQSAESRDDFIHKMKLADKEASETKYWLILCERSKHYPHSSELMARLDVIRSLLSKIIITAKRNRPKK